MHAASATLFTTGLPHARPCLAEGRKMVVPYPGGNDERAGSRRTLPRKSLPEKPLPPALARQARLEPRQQGVVACALLPVLAVWQANGVYLPALAQKGAHLFWMADLCQWVVLPMALLGLLAHTVSLRPSHYGLGIPGTGWRTLAWQAAAVFVTAGLAFLVARNLAWVVLRPPASPWPLAQMFPGGMAGAAVRTYAALSAGLVESIFFIGLPWLLYRSARAKPSRRWFTLLVSAIFALAHWEQGSHLVAAAFFAHLVLCTWFFHWRTLWPVVFGHSLVDLAGFA
jgi:hypothetical protein